MRNPSIDKLLDVVDSKYKLSILAAKRARAIELGSKVQIEKSRSVKPVGIALEEILAGRLDIKY